MENVAGESVLHRRVAPKLAVVAIEGTILSSEPGLWEFLENFLEQEAVQRQKLPSRIREAISGIALAGPGNAMDPVSITCVPVPRLLVRATLLRGPDGSCIAVSFERLQVRSDIRQTAAHHALTTRETEIAEQLVQGLSTESIAKRLSIARNTVREHVKHIYAKLGVGTRAELVSRLLNLSAG